MRREQTILLDGLKIMGRIFWGPSLEECTEMVQEKYLDRLESLTSVLKTGAVDGLHEIVSIIKSFPGGDSLYQHLEEGYVRLFISAKGSITAPLYESCYEFEGAPLMGRAAAEMKERFEAKGLSVAETIQEPPDHLSIELEYLYFLLDKGWGEQDDALVAEAAEFASDTLLPWVSELSEKLASEEECRYYPLMATIVVEILSVIGRISEASN
jgi:TorA maturation chaperone TorD